MFKSNKLAGVLNFRNGGGIGPLVVGGSMTLAGALQCVDAAEQALADARSVAKAAARRENKSVASLFGESRFILRASGEKWADEGRRQGEKTMIAIFSRTLDMDAADADSPFHFLAKRLIRPGAMDAQRAEFASADTVAERILAAARRAKSSGADERPLPPADSVAGQILAAGARARTKTGGHKDD
jgi:hypothetical protein